MNIIEEYKQGKSIKTLSILYKLPTAKIKDMLVSNNISIRKGILKTVDPDQINQLYDQGLSTYQIAEKLGCSSDTVRRYVKNIRDVSTRNSNRDANKISESCKKKWQDPEYVKKVKEATSTQEYKARLKEVGREYYKSGIGVWIKTQEAKETISNNVKELWKDDNFRSKQTPYFSSRAMLASQEACRKFKIPEFRKEWTDKLRITSTINKALTPSISGVQKQFYYILNRSNINFYEEGEKTKIGPFYVVDCIIPKQQDMIKDLIVEIQGEYWHSFQNTIIKDKQKATYIKNHTDYDLLYIDELDMSCWSEVCNKLKEFGLSLLTESYSIDQLEIKKITEEEARQFYNIFHYTSSIRKGATTYGVYYFDKLIAAISYTYPIRTQIAGSLNLQMKQVMEISRLARATNIECPNLLSWFIGSTRKQLPPEVKCVISYSDSTYGHTGGVYKSCGFVNDKEVAPDYYYLSINGKYHKKTIWDKSKRFNMTEEEYAISHNLQKVMTDSKRRWIYYL